MTPWLTMWVSPRKAIRTIVEENPSKGIYILTTVMALENFFFYSNLWSLGLRSYSSILFVIGLVLSPFLGYLWIWIMSHIFYMTGKWMNGTASFLQIRAAVAWSKIPAFGILLSWFCILYLAPEEAFINVGGGDPYILPFHLLNTFLGIWSFILLIHTIREVQQFTLGQAIKNIALSWCLFTTPLLILFFVTLISSQY